MAVKGTCFSSIFVGNQDRKTTGHEIILVEKEKFEFFKRKKQNNVHLILLERGDLILFTFFYFFLAAIVSVFDNS